MAAGYSQPTQDWKSKEYRTAQRTAIAILDKPKVQGEIERIFASSKLTATDRAHVVAGILHSPTKETTHETYDANGILISRQVIKSTNASEQLKATDIANRMDGLYSRASDISRMQSRVLQPLLDHYSKLMRRALAEEGHEGVPPIEYESDGDVVDDGVGEHTDSAVPAPSEASHESVHESIQAHVVPEDGEGRGVPGG
jgi:hypothetical protein